MVTVDYGPAKLVLGAVPQKVLTRSFDGRCMSVSCRTSQELEFEYQTSEHLFQDVLDEDGFGQDIAAEGRVDGRQRQQRLKRRHQRSRLHLPPRAFPAHLLDTIL